MNRSIIQDKFWSARLEVNAHKAIYHQWEQLQASGCIENFRIAAGEVEGLREGWFFADSDAYKWLEAAARICASGPDPRLMSLIDELTALVGRAQTPDGYIFTYNQIHFPGTRWQNLQIQHELYCHGHLIEAGVSHYEAFGNTSLLDIARKAADRVVADFHGKDAAFTPGHEEIEIALLRLHQITPGDSAYLDMASQFIEQRGRTRGFALSLLQQNLDVDRRKKIVKQKRDEFLSAHPGYQPIVLPPDNFSKQPPAARLRWFTNVLSGKYFQQHAPVREQTTPVGHSVRFGYLETATAMLARLTGDHSLLETLEQAWDKMVTRRMYVTGGLGAIPSLEGFGNDYELDPEYAYAETCAALASLFWNWEMAVQTGQARYDDLFEWQLYNAASVGMGLDGTDYLYNNPLACHGGVERRSWFSVPCCPSNLSRTWADLGRYVFSATAGNLFIHQYIGSLLSDFNISAHGGDCSIGLKMTSGLPWDSRVSLEFTLVTSAVSGSTPVFDLHFRHPAWAGAMQVSINGAPAVNFPARQTGSVIAASGYETRPAVYQTFKRAWAPGDILEIGFEMPVRLLHAHSRVKGHAGKMAVTRGPLVYCLEDQDNPSTDIFTVRLDPASLVPAQDATLLGGIVKLVGKTPAGQPLTLIPYFLWGNRGPSRMTVWINT